MGKASTQPTHALGHCKFDGSGRPASVRREHAATRCRPVVRCASPLMRARARSTPDLDGSRLAPRLHDARPDAAHGHVGVAPARSSRVTAATTTDSPAVAGKRGGTRTCAARRCGMPWSGSGRLRSPKAIGCAAPSLTFGRTGISYVQIPVPNPGAGGSRLPVRRRRGVSAAIGAPAQSRASSVSSRPRCPAPGRRASGPTSTSRALMRPSVRSRRTVAQSSPLRIRWAVCAFRAVAIRPATCAE